jgi:ADP-ribose pyrophosphatase
MSVQIKRPAPRITRPANAKKVFTGIIYSAYQWPQVQFDGSVKTFEVLKRPDTVEVIPVTLNHQIIILEQRQPANYNLLYGFPGGRVEPKEEVQDAAARELLEESGYQAGSLELLQVVQPLEKIDWVVYTFIARDAIPVSAQQPDPGEKIKVTFVDFEGFMNFVLSPDFYDPEIVRMVLEAKLDPKKMAAFKSKFF